MNSQKREEGLFLTQNKILEDVTYNDQKSIQQSDCENICLLKKKVIFTPNLNKKSKQPNIQFQPIHKENVQFTSNHKEHERFSVCCKPSAYERNKSIQIFLKKRKQDNLLIQNQARYSPKQRSLSRERLNEPCNILKARLSLPGTQKTYDYKNPSPISDNSPTTQYRVQTASLMRNDPSNVNEKVIFEHKYIEKQQDLIIKKQQRDKLIEKKANSFFNMQNLLNFHSKRQLLKSIRNKNIFLKSANLCKPSQYSEEQMNQNSKTTNGNTEQHQNKYYSICYSNENEINVGQNSFGLHDTTNSNLIQMRNTPLKYQVALSQLTNYNKGNQVNPEVYKITKCNNIPLTKFISNSKPISQKKSISQRTTISDINVSYRDSSSLIMRDFTQPNDPNCSKDLCFNPNIKEFSFPKRVSSSRRNAFESELYDKQKDLNVIKFHTIDNDNFNSFQKSKDKNIQAKVIIREPPLNTINMMTQ